MPNGGRYWRLNIVFEKKAQTLSFGTYPVVSLKEARIARDEARAKKAKGINPSAEKQALRAAESDSFEEVAREWHSKFSHTWADSHALKNIRKLEKDIFPFLGNKSISEITAPDLLKCLRRIEARGALETTRRTKEICGQVFRYGIATGRCERDPTPDLRGAIPPAPSKNYPTITDPKGVAALLRAMDGYQGSSYPTSIALSLLPFVFVRSSELRGAKWSEFDIESALWNIPAERMKMGVEHIVPLSKQALKLLREMHEYSGDGAYVFPGVKKGKSISDGTLNAALRSVGYKDKMTTHGFRHMASTILHEQNWRSDAIERQLAHSEKNAIKGIYNKAKHLPERIKMMQAYANYLDVLKAGSNVTAIRRAS